MRFASYHRAIHLRAASALLVLVLMLGWLATPLSLLTVNEPDVCAMDCCVAEGHCCCTPRHAYVEGQVPSSTPALHEPTQLTAACPANCTAAASVAQSQLPRAERAALHFSLVANAPLLHWREQAQAHYLLAFQPISPRAPPALHLSV